jgi:hypothetical protein
MALSAWAAASDGDKAHPDLASTAAPAVVDNAGHFTGWAAVSGNVDLGGDVILSGAFQLKGQRLELPVLLHHKSDSPAGVVIVEETRMASALRDTSTWTFRRPGRHGR